jgi:hypothetical protein
LEQQPGAQEFVEFSAPDGLTTSYTLVFPDELPAAGAVFYVETYADSEVRLNWFYAGTDTARVYRRSFTDSDLELGVLTAFHGLTVESATVQLWSNSGEVVIPDRVFMHDTNTIKVDLSSFKALAASGEIQGTWRVCITG